jgi:hypothetical protein
MLSHRVSCRIGLALLATCLTAQMAGAQESDAQRAQRLLQQSQSELEQQTRQQGFRPTRGAALDQSIEDLLNAGWGVVAASQGAAGHAFTLRDGAGRRWALCTLTTRGGAGSPGDQQSLCRALN